MNREGPIIVHAGPSLPRDRRPADTRILWRPPAVAGDGLAALDLEPQAVVLIDGLFDEQPAIRHKELLVLLARGVRVSGAASMGALRAAELHRFGMEGVGRVFTAYARGRLTGDDEVALLHGPAELDWPGLTEALVNVRATLLRAVRSRVIGAPAARGLLRAAAAIFYKARTWDAVIASAGADLELERFAEWLPQGRFDLKRADAQACVARALEQAGAAPQAWPEPPATLFTAALAASISG